EKSHQCSSSPIPNHTAGPKLPPQTNKQANMTVDPCEKLKQRRTLAADTFCITVWGSSEPLEPPFSGITPEGPEVPAQGSPVPPPIAASVSPSLFNAVYQLIKNRIHRLPVIEPVSGNVLHILTHKRILKFLHIFGAMLPRPRFLQRTIQELGVGTFRDVAKVLETASVYMALETFVDRRVSALPVTNEAGEVVGLYSRFDVIVSISTGAGSVLGFSGQALGGTRVYQALEFLVGGSVHRLVLVDEKNSLRGIVSLSDILQALVLSPAGIDALNS
uniref:CBS domain-containing protein n=1 Tax=Chelonoidis abingdonii TaxID=106734 RepID=A0A8C0QM86_CHEAB